MSTGNHPIICLDFNGVVPPITQDVRRFDDMEDKDLLALYDEVECRGREIRSLDDASTAIRMTRNRLVIDQRDRMSLFSEKSFAEAKKLYETKMAKLTALLEGSK